VDLSGTIGAGYAWSDSESDLGISLSGQYYYNGNDDADDQGHNGAAMASVTLTYKLSVGGCSVGVWNRADATAVGDVAPRGVCESAGWIGLPVRFTKLYGDSDNRRHAGCHREDFFGRDGLLI